MHNRQPLLQEDEGASGSRWVVVLLGVIAGGYFVVLSAFSIRVLASPRHVARPYEVIFATVTAYLAYRGFRAAILGGTDEESVVSALRAAMFGAFVGLLALVALYLSFGINIHSFFAHSIGLYASQLTMFLLLLAFVCTGFAAGFVLAMKKPGARSSHPR